MTYATEFRNKLTHRPIVHRLRLLKFWLETVQHSLWLKRLEPLLNQQNSILKVDTCLQPPPYHYRGYRGPWIEEIFYEYWLKHKIKSHIVYLPIFFDGFFLHSQVHHYSPIAFEHTYQRMQQILDDEVQPDRLYFTVLGMYDFPIWDWHKFPKNVLVFSSAGGGDIPIPLLKGSPAFRYSDNETLVSFMGSLGGASNAGNVRARMYEQLKDFAHFGQGSNWRSVMAKSTFTLCPRGQARASFRLYEALSVGSIPIYIWDDVEWLPYQDVLDWSEFSISINVKDLDRLPDLIRSHSEMDITKKQQRIAELYPQFFTLEAVCQNIVQMLDQYRSLEDVYQVTNQRTFT